MKYLPLLNLELAHEYYPDGRCPDFTIEPTPGTHKLIRDCRGTLKSVSNGIRILVPVNERDTPFVPLPSKPVFGFRLLLQNPDFGLFTDLAEIEQAAAPLFTNADPARGGDLVLESRETWATEHFIVRQPAPKDPFILGGRPLESIHTAGAFVVKGLGEKTGRKNYDEAARVIRVNTSTASPGTPFSITYPTRSSIERGVFADVEIKYDEVPARLGGEAGPFRVVFKARQAWWKYYIVTDKADNKSATPTIEDREKTVLFEAGGQTDLTQTPDPADSIASDLAAQYPNRRYFRLVSNAPIPCRKTARKGIQLRLNGDKVIDSLPNPALHNYSIDVRNAAREYTVYHIVKYFTQ